MTSIVWAVAGAAGHYAVDWTHKFNMRSVSLGVVLDQAGHLVMILGSRMLIAIGAVTLWRVLRRWATGSHSLRTMERLRVIRGQAQDGVAVLGAIGAGV